LQYAASLAAHSRHPLSQAVAMAYDGHLLPASDVQEHPGAGLSGIVDGKKTRLGSRAWCGPADIQTIPHMELWLDIEGQDPSALMFSDGLRTDSAETISLFHKQGFAPVLLSGDRAPVVADVARLSGIADFKAEQSPAQKYAYVESLKQDGHKVLMVGDGLNDAPTLAAATVSIAPGTAIGAAQNAADIIFMGDKFAPVFQAYETACLTQKLVRENFALAVLYNVVAIPVAALGLLTPLLAALAMSGSSLIVILNSFRVRWRA
jgi:Cu2+-exporting ATPase